MHEGFPQPVASIKPKNGQKISKNGQKTVKKLKKLTFPKIITFCVNHLGVTADASELSTTCSTHLTKTSDSGG